MKSYTTGLEKNKNCSQNIHFFLFYTLFMFLLLLCGVAANGYILPSETENFGETSTIVPFNAPTRFVENIGQFEREYLHQMLGNSSNIWLTKDAIFVSLFEPIKPVLPRNHKAKRISLPFQNGDDSDSIPSLTTTTSLKISFINGNAEASVQTLNRHTSKTSYFIGHDPSEWYEDIPTWDHLRFEGLYTGIDLELLGNTEETVLEFVLSTETNVETIRLKVEGAEYLTLGREGRLIAKTAVGPVLFPIFRVSYQYDRHVVYSLMPEVNGNEVTFYILETEGAADFVPITQTGNGGNGLQFSTFLGGQGDDRFGDIAVDDSGAIYLTGQSRTGFPTTVGVLDESSINGDMFVAKFDPNGELIFSTFIGGIGEDFGNAIAVGQNGEIFVGGSTDGLSDFPATPGALAAGDTQCISATGCPTDGVLAKLSADGSSLIYSTYLGAPGSWNYISDIAIASDGGIYFTGRAQSGEYFPTTPGTFQRTSGDTPLEGENFTIYGWQIGDAFIGKLNSSGSNLELSTLLGGNYSESGSKILIDSNGSVYLTGVTYSSNFPVTDNTTQEYFGFGRCDYGSPVKGPCSDIFIAKFDATLSRLQYSTFLGGDENDWLGGMSIIDDRFILVAGTTASANYPITKNNSEFITAKNPECEVSCSYAFLTKVDTLSGNLEFSLIFGGSGNYDWASDILIDEMGSILVVGSTTSIDFPVTSSAYNTRFTEGSYSVSGISYPTSDVFLTKFDSPGENILYSTLIGGTGNESGVRFTHYLNGAVYIAGDTRSENFPTTLGSFQSEYGGGQCRFFACSDIFLTKLMIPSGKGVLLPYSTVTPTPPNTPMIEATSTTFSTVTIPPTPTSVPSKMPDSTLTPMSLDEQLADPIALAATKVIVTPTSEMENNSVSNNTPIAFYPAIILFVGAVCIMTVLILVRVRTKKMRE